MKFTPKSVLSAASLMIGGFIGASALVAFAASGTWTSAPPNPPQNNVPAPINVGNGTSVLSSLINGIGQEKTDSLAIDGLLFAPNLVVATGTPQKGDVLTAVDSAGTVGWGSVSVAGSGLNIGYVTPTDLATGIGGNISWTTISGLQSYGVPADAVAVILGTTIQGCDVNGYITSIYGRADASGSTYTLASVETAGGGAPQLANFNQGIYPVSAANNVSLQYSTSNHVCSPSKITLYGYVTPGSSSSSSGGAIVPSGSWCGYSSTGTAGYSCEGQSVDSSCPSGYSLMTIDYSTNAHTCVKN